MNAGTMLEAFREMDDVNGERLKQTSVGHPRREVLKADYSHATNQVRQLEVLVDQGIAAAVEELTA